MQRRVVDNKYFFSVSKKVQGEIENRRTRLNPATSPIGFGAVAASIVKESTSGVAALYATCLEQVKNNAMRGQDDWLKLENFFGTSKKPRDMVKETAARKHLVTEIEKEFSRPQKKAKPTPHSALARYHQECTDNYKYGAVGLLPPQWKNGVPDLENFVETSDGSLLNHFCKKMIK